MLLLQLNLVSKNDLYKADQCIIIFTKRERSGSVVECLTRDREAAGLSITGVTAL